jgi:hypothetical protein
MSFSCLNCDASFISKRDLDRHLARKNPCLNEEEKAKKNDCPYCDNTYSDFSNRIRHMKNCKKNPKNNNEINLREENLNLREEVINLREEIINLRENNLNQNNNILGNHNSMVLGDSVINNNNTTNNNTTNNNNNFALKSFYGDIVKSVTTPDFIRMIDGILSDENNTYDILDLLIKKIHFNINTPEYHNIYSTNIRDKITHIYDDDAWVVGDESDFNVVAYSMIDYVKEFNECYTEMIIEHPELKSLHIENNISNFNVNRKNYRNLDMAVLQLIHKYKNVPIATRKQMKN